MCFFPLENHFLQRNNNFLNILKDLFTFVLSDFHLLCNLDSSVIVACRNYILLFFSCFIFYCNILDLQCYTSFMRTA